MRYQIHRFQQASLIELGLNTEDALFLDWLMNWKDGNNMERIQVDGDNAYWVDYGNVVEELPILFSPVEEGASEEEIKRKHKTNTTKVARMLKGNLSKVLTRHEKKVKSRTKVYISFDRKQIDFLINGNKKADTGKVSTTQKSKKSNFDNSIPQDIKISKEENIKSEAINLINKSSVSIKKADLKDCEEEFKDIDRLALALVYCEGKEQNGIKALRLAYKNELWNKKDNSNSVKTRFHNINNRTQQYSEEELEKLIFENQKDRFKDIEKTSEKIQNGEVDRLFKPRY